ncbi:MAG: hypothetical protein U0V03_06230 [Bacteroidia bacterium]
MKFYFVQCIIAILFFSCVKDKPTLVPQENITLTETKKVYVINEGGLNDNKSSVSLYDPGNNSVIENYYASQNNNQILGSIAQSLSFFQSNFYVVINNSNKIVVCNNQFKKTSQISGLTSPRYFLPVSNQKAYVSDLYANQIHIIDLNTNTKTGNITCNGWTEKMLMIYNKVFVTNNKRNYLYVINAINNTITDSVFVGKYASSMVIDRYDNIWVLASGEQSTSSQAMLTKIDALSLNSLKTFTFNLGQSPNNLCLNKTKDTLYYLNNGVYRLTILDNQLPQNALITSGTKIFYGLGVNPNNYNIYVADAVDYVQKSNVFIYNTNGELKHNFKAGINANGFYFEQ